MKTFEDFISGLQRDIDIPEKVDKRFEETLQGLEPGRRKFHLQWVKAASAAAAFVIVLGAVMVSNPALASNLPFIGSIFEKVEKDVIYSGDYSKKKTLENTSGEKSVYSAQDQDIRVTVSEVYSDGFSIFATVKMESPKYDFSKVDRTQDGRQSINLATSYGVNKDVGPYDFDILLDGKNQGKDSFIGMMKFDKEEYSMESGMINISIKNIMIAQSGTEDEEFVDGNWKLSIPYETDWENSREIPVGKEITDSLKIEKLFISPYQLVIFSDVADCKPYVDMTDDEINDILGGNATASQIEEVKNSVDTGYYEYAIFDQDGKVIEFEEIGDKKDELEQDIYALQGRKVSQIHMYVTQNKKNMTKLHQAKKESEAAKLSEKDFVIEINQ